MRTDRVVPAVLGFMLGGLVVSVATTAMHLAGSQGVPAQVQVANSVPQGLFETERWVDFTHVFEWKPESDRND
jgi:hypothetical protein